MKYICLVLASAAVLVSAHPGHDHSPLPTRAIVRLVGNNIQGNITFTQLDNGKVHVTGEIVGMPKGHYGFNIHETGDMTGGCESAGGHFNPEHKDHGHPEDEHNHVGDLGNAVFNEKKYSKIDQVDGKIALSGSHNIIGRLLVLNERADDHGHTDHPDSKKTGNSGAPVACGVIGIL